MSFKQILTFCLKKKKEQTTFCLALCKDWVGKNNKFTFGNIVFNLFGDKFDTPYWYRIQSFSWWKERVSYVF